MLQIRKYSYCQWAGQEISETHWLRKYCQIIQPVKTINGLALFINSKYSSRYIYLSDWIIGFADQIIVLNHKQFMEIKD